MGSKVLSNLTLVSHKLFKYFILTNAGGLQGSAVGSDEIVTKVVDAFTNVENGGNVTTEANLAAKAIGTTLATAFTESRTKVRS